MLGRAPPICSSSGLPGAVRTCDGSLLDALSATRTGRRGRACLLSLGWARLVIVMMVVVNRARRIQERSTIIVRTWVDIAVVEVIERQRLRCLGCRHEWVTRVAKPIRCPGCKGVCRYVGKKA